MKKAGLATGVILALTSLTAVSAVEPPMRFQMKLDLKDFALTVPTTVSAKVSARIYARSRLSTIQYNCLSKLWMRESGWNYRSHNRRTGAYGIPQALPGSKMRSAGKDWKTNPITQVKWGLSYIRAKYGSPCGAWHHFQRTGWY